MILNHLHLIQWCKLGWPFFFCRSTFQVFDFSFIYSDEVKVNAIICTGTSLDCCTLKMPRNHICVHLHGLYITEQLRANKTHLLFGH